MSFTVVLGILTRPFGANYSKADIPLILIFTHVFAMSATNPNANDNKNYHQRWRKHRALNCFIVFTVCGRIIPLRLLRLLEDLRC